MLRGDIWSPQLNNLNDLPKFDYLETKFFSEYIPQLGFTTSVDFILNGPIKSLFYVVASLAPPGRLYRNDKRPLGLQDINAVTDVQTMYQLNFNSPAKAISFIDGAKKFYITKPESTNVLIYEIFEVKLSGNSIKKVEPFGFTFLPMFQYVEMDGNSDKLEIYINTSVNQLLLYKGKLTEDFVNKMTSNTNFNEFLLENIENRILDPIPKASLIVKLYDNQFESIFTNAEDTYSKVSQSYMMIKNPKNMRFNYKKDFVNNRAGLLFKLLGKNYSQSDYETQIYDYIEANIF